MLMKAYRYKQLDKERDMHYQAFLNFAVQSTTGKGKNIKARYDRFDKFFDYDKLLRELEGGESSKADDRTKEILRMQKKLNERR